MKMRIIILLSMFLAVISFNDSYGQKPGKKIKVTGRVVDEMYSSIANAIIIIDGQKTGYVTDRNGFYKLKISPENKKIGVFTYTNGSVEEEIDGRIRINFTFKGSVPDQQSDKVDPDDEVIDTGISTIKKKALTTSVGKIDGTKSKYASYNSIYDMLRGEIPGVQVNGTSVLIRGATSMNSSNEPLFVVDGVPVSTIENIEPRMVKTIQVLKGSAAAIYGSRGGHGVIVINLLGAGD